MDGPTIAKIAAGLLSRQLYMTMKLDHLRDLLCPWLIHPSVPRKKLWGSTVLNLSRLLLSLHGFDIIFLLLLDPSH